ncbi:hypothetical protein HMN09_00262500 [Mycena chlorophos]|uniref:Uncharacterized protein n=1 Tax=Mycena chlorophos TaxID=658473 RepID=A0A8H6THY1_MYCCL|nr:hypothetical protein HMN09_00262500 [Mycena chlorophos]
MGHHSKVQLEAISGSLALSLYTVSIEWLFYGIYLVLFVFCLRTLRRPRPSRMTYRRAFTIGVSAMFLFSTSHWILQLVNAGEFIALKLLEAKQHEQDFVADKTRPAQMWNRINIAMGVFFVMNNIIADSIFVFRCYSIWGRKKRIVAVPILMLLVSACLGLASVITCGQSNIAEFLYLTWIFPVSMLFSILTTALLVTLTAGRIWWIARSARAIMGPTVVRQYRTIMAMILESGALSLTPGILYLLLALTESSATDVVLAAMAQISGIAPTIIVVRVGLGNSINDSESFRAMAAEEGPVLDIRPFDEEKDMYL